MEFHDEIVKLAKLRDIWVQISKFNREFGSELLSDVTDSIVEKLNTGANDVAEAYKCNVKNVIEGEIFKFSPTV